jgi:hypothetical protein
MLHRTPDDSAVRIFRLLQRDPRPRAVFLVGASIRTSYVDASLSDELVRHPSFIGVYDHRAHEEDIAADILYVTERIAKTPRRIA